MWYWIVAGGVLIVLGAWIIWSALNKFELSPEEREEFHRGGGL
jgi:putative Mn2+ efflux pump MntP